MGILLNVIKSFFVEENAETQEYFHKHVLEI